MMTTVAIIFNIDSRRTRTATSTDRRKVKKTHKERRKTYESATGTSLSPFSSIFSADARAL